MDALTDDDVVTRDAGARIADTRSHAASMPNASRSRKSDSTPGSGTRVVASGRRLAIDLSLQALLVLAILVVTLQLWRTDLRVPFNYWGDTLLQLSVAKNIAEGGWIWFVDRLGAPFGFPVVAFPQNLTTTSVFLELLRLFSKEPGFIVNVYWLLTVVGASVNAHLSLRVMGYRMASATALGTLYALLPYAFYRNVAHLPVVYPFIPVLAAFAVQLGANTASALTSRWGKYVIVCAVAQACDYVYNTFFAVFVFVVAALLAFLYHRSKRQATRALVVIAVLVAVTGFNLAPSFVEWSRHGKPPNTGYKVPAEAELFGLKLRQLLSPVQPSKFALVHRYGVAEQQFPNENENTTTRLGSLLSLGLVAMIAAGFFSRRLTPQVRSASALALACFLLSTVGGFGALFNLLIAPDIRAYNRIVVFIAFFLIVYLADLLDRWMPAPGESRAIGGIRISRFATNCVLGLAVMAGVADQGQAARPIVDRYASDGDIFRGERALVNEVERRHPEGGAVMQLPETLFPPDAGKERMLPYDHARPYLSSSRMSWSWPSFSYRRAAWYEALGDPKEPQFVNRLVASGFVGIWIDRWGYTAAELAQLESSLTSRLGAPVVGGVDHRYAYFDLSSIKAQAQSQVSDRERYALLHPLVVSYDRGFYDEEHQGAKRWRWSTQHSIIRLRNEDERARSVDFTTLVQAGSAGSLHVAIDGHAMQPIPFAATQSKPLELSLTIPAGASTTVSMSFDGPQLPSGSDSRSLYFALFDAAVEAR